MLITTAVLVAVQSFAELPPDLVCEAGSELQVFNDNLSVSKYESDVLYRFSEGKLYLSSDEREEYLYGELTEVAFLRYVSGNKSAADFRKWVFEVVLPSLRKTGSMDGGDIEIGERGCQSKRGC